MSESWATKGHKDFALSDYRDCMGLGVLVNPKTVDGNRVADFRGGPGFWA